MSDARANHHCPKANKLDFWVRGNTNPSPMALDDRLVLSDSDFKSFGDPDYRAQYIHILPIVICSEFTN